MSLVNRRIPTNLVWYFFIRPLCLSQWLCVNRSKHVIKFQLELWLFTKALRQHLKAHNEAEHKQLMDNDKQKQRINYIQTTKKTL